MFGAVRAEILPNVQITARIMTGQIEFIINIYTSILSHARTRVLLFTWGLLCVASVPFNFECQEECGNTLHNTCTATCKLQV